MELRLKQVLCVTRSQPVVPEGKRDGQTTAACSSLSLTGMSKNEGMERQGLPHSTWVASRDAQGQHATAFRSPDGTALHTAIHSSTQVFDSTMVRASPNLPGLCSHVTASLRAPSRPGP